MKKDHRVYLAQILERINRILRYTDEGKDVFLRDLVIQDAVIRNFEVIGEAAKRIPVEYREATPTIPTTFSWPQHLRWLFRRNQIRSVSAGQCHQEILRERHKTL